MSLRSTLTAVFLLVALCGGGLYMAHSIFSRDAQMRQAEVDFATEHRDEIEAAAARFESSRETAAQASWEAGGDLGNELEEEPLSLDDWYADAGSSSEPFDPAPEDKSYLVNDAEPYSDAEPIDF